MACNYFKCNDCNFLLLPIGNCKRRFFFLYFCLHFVADKPHVCVCVRCICVSVELGGERGGTISINRLCMFSISFAYVVCVCCVGPEKPPPLLLFFLLFFLLLLSAFDLQEREREREKEGELHVTYTPLEHAE